MFKPLRSTLAVAGLAALSAVAQEKSTVTTNRLSEVVVTATRTEEPVSQVAASVSIINRASIEEKKFHTLAEALESVPGLVVARNGTSGQATSVFLRGTESNHTLLTVDGRRVPSMLAGGYDWGNITLDNIERIEVVRSANSALYGGDAIGGVVNLITRTGRGLKSPEHGVSFEGGSFNSFRETAHSRGAAGRFDYAFAISQFNAAYPRNNNDYRSSGIRSSFGYEVSDKLYLDLKASYLQTDGGSPGSISYPSAVDHLKRETIHVSPGITWAPSDSWETKLFYTFENQLQPSRDSGSDNRLNVAAHVIDWQNILKATDTWKLSAGMLWQDQMIDRNRGRSGDINANLQTLGGFLQSQWSPSNGFTLINAVRHDAYSDYQSATTWRQAASYRIPQSDTLLFANVARSVAPPTAQDLYYPGNYSNPNLKAERALSWEFGAEQPLPGSQLSLSATWFQHKYRDFIQVDGNYVPQNIAKATSEGIEMGLKWKPAGYFTAAVSYTYLTAENDATNLRLIRRPRHQLGLDAVIRPIEKLTLSTGASWVVERQDSLYPGQVPIGDYLLIRAAASYQINKYSQIWIRGDNLLDQKYDALRGYPALRLGLYGGLAFMF